MNCSEIILLAIALSVDAFIVSFSYGLFLEQRHKLNSVELGISTGFFQAFMPFIAYIITDRMKFFLMPYSKIIVFTIFCYLGLNFIFESIKKSSEKKRISLNFKILLLIGIATSIDAFSSGITLSLTNSPIIISSLLIGIITFNNSIIGYFIGHYLKTLKTKYIELAGGIILVGLAIKQILP